MSSAALVRPPMERKAFLQMGCRCGVGAVASVLLAPVGMAEGVPSARSCLQQQPDLASQAHAWILDLLAAMDTELDQPTRARILQACGRAEALRGAPVPPPPTVTLEQLAVRLRVRLGEENVRLAGNRLEVTYGNRCECPLVGPTPERLSDTWCECARGYMMAMMSGRLGRPVQVDLVEAVKRGGQRCRWVFQA
jgi:hypothetical protein